jgi:UDP:flavonoid glycosyltransferase YjiC (YdhE family)
MNVLIVTNPGLGHFFPMVRTAQQLQHDGHRVRVATAATFGVHVSGAGLTHVPAGMDWLESRIEETFPEHGAQAGQHEDRAPNAIGDIFCDAAAHPMVDDLLRIIEADPPDLILRNDFEFASCIAAELTGIPVATLGIEFNFPEHLWDKTCGEQLRFLRSAHGLRAKRAIDVLYTHPHFALMPPEYEFPEFQVPGTRSWANTGVYDAAPEHDLAAWVDELPLRPNVCVTLGTVFNRSPDLLACFFEALSSLDVNVIVTTGIAIDRERIPALTGARNIHTRPYIPGSQLLPRCALMISHGGFGTAMSAMQAGVPQIIVPPTPHHACHARRVAALGVGDIVALDASRARTLGSAIPALSPETLRQTASRLLSDSGYRTRAQALRQRMSLLPGAADVARSLAEIGARPPAAATDTAVAKGGD